jgi:hypothetical protein
MKTSITIIILVAATLKAGSQEVNKIIFDEKAEQDILYGRCTQAAFTDPMFDSWYSFEYNGYAPKSAVISQLNTLINGVAIKVILGTWRGDSHREVPRFLKIISLLETNERMIIELICVNRSKTAVEAGVPEGYVEFVPTFIVSRNNVELGRIVETPIATLEEDLLNLLK